MACAASPTSTVRSAAQREMAGTTATRLCRTESSGPGRRRAARTAMSRRTGSGPPIRCRPRCAGGSVIPLRREICVDGRADPLFRSVTEVVASEGFHSWLGMPVCNGDTARGNPLPVLGQHHHLPGRPRSRGPGSGPTPSASTFRATRPSRRLPHRHRSEIPLPPRSHVAHGRRFDLHMLRRTRAAPGFGAYPGRRRGGPSPALLVLGNVNTSSAGSM